MMNWSDFSEKPTTDTIGSYPTIVDIIESILEEEENGMLHRDPLSSKRNLLDVMGSPGKYLAAVDSNNDEQVILIPTNRQPFTFYRGEKSFFSTCPPSIMRDNKNKEEYKLMACLRAEELKVILNTHPVIKFLLHSKMRHLKITNGFSLKVQTDAIAQHYGIATPYLDLTNDKWVAAFFAVSSYNKDEGIHYVINPDNIDSNNIDSLCGSFYRLREVDFFSPNAPLPIGMQYFNRPGRQFAFVVDLTEYGDFLHYPNVERIFFRHDKKANQLVFDLCQQGKKFFPEDSLSNIVDELEKTHVFSSDAIESCKEKVYNALTSEEWGEMLEKYGISSSEKPLVSFNPIDVEKEWNDWTKGGMQRYINQLIVAPYLKL